MSKMISYEKKDTVIHELSGFTKLLFFLLWCMISALTFDTRILILMLVMGAAIFMISKTSWSQVSGVFLAIMFSSSLYGFFVLQVLREFTDLSQLSFGLVLFSDRGDHAGVLETCICQISSVLSHRAVIYAR